MTLTIESPVGTLDVSLLEERQSESPLTCTRGGPRDVIDHCALPAKWEAMCMGCGHIFRRCAPHWEEDVQDAMIMGDGAPARCPDCFTLYYLDQFVRIGA